MERKYRVDSVAPQIAAFLKPVLKKAGFRLSFEVQEGEAPHPEIENPEIVVRFGGPDVDLLLSNKAELLLALEQLTMEVLQMPSEDHSLLCFDARDYRILRMEELRLSALTAADKVKKSRTPFRFNPMTSRERRIIHLALRHETAVRSESSGVGPHRQVVIYPAGMASLPEGPAPALPPRGRSRSARR